MAKIALEGMHFYAYHGVYPEEQLIGTDYIVDVYLEASVGKAAVGDDLNNTVNYETIYLICKTVMNHPTNLIETVASRIALRIKHQFHYLKDLRVRVRKKNPPLGGRVDWAGVEVQGNFSKSCGRCGKPMLCYGDRTCWCLDAHIDKGTLEQLKVSYGRNCLCRECIQFFTGQ